MDGGAVFVAVGLGVSSKIAKRSASAGISSFCPLTNIDCVVSAFIAAKSLRLTLNFWAIPESVSPGLTV